MRPHRLAWSCRFTAVAMVAASLTVAAQQGSDATMIGVVTDESGAVLPGATVTATSPALQVPAIVRVTDAKGEYRLNQLPIGTYTVRYEIQGFTPVQREGVRLTLGFIATINVALKVAGLEESLTVVAGSPVVDVSSTAPRVEFLREQLEELPTTRNGVLSLTIQSPGIRISARSFDVGGSQFTSGASYNNFGRSGDNWEMLDGVPTGGGLNGGVYYDFAGAAEAQIQAAGNGVQMPGTGVWLNTVVKSGGNDFHGSGFYMRTAQGLQSDNLDDRLRAAGVASATQLIKRYDSSGDLGGRIIRDNLWFYGGARRAWDEPVPLGAPIDPATGDPGAAPRGQGFWTTKVSYQMAPSQKLVGLYAGNWKYNIRGVGQFNSWESRVEQDQYGETEKLEWQGTFGNQVTASAMVGYWDYLATIRGFSPDTVATFDLTTLRYTGDQISSWVAPLNAFQWRRSANAQLTWYKPDLLGSSHEFRGGFDVAPATQNWSRESRASGNYYLRFRGGVPFQIGTFNMPVNPYQKSNLAGAYLSDKWSMGPLTLNLGFRFDHNAGWIPETTRAAGEFAPAQTFTRVDFPAWNLITPRLFFAWDVTGNASTVIKGGWGRYGKIRYVPDDLTPADTNALVTTFYTWHDLNGNKLYEPGEVDLRPNGVDFQSVSFTSPGSADPRGAATRVPNPNEKQPRTDEFNINLEHELMQNIALRVSGVVGRDSNVRRLEGVNRPYSAYNIPVTSVDPGPDARPGTADDPGTTVTYWEYSDAFRGPAFEVTQAVNDSNATQTTKAVELAVSKRMSNNWQLMSSAGRIWRKWPFAANYAASNPNAESFSANNTAAWYLKIGGSYRFAAPDILLSANFNGTSGEPYQRTVLAGGGRTIASLVVPVEPLGSRYYPNAYLLDFRVEKRIRVIGNHRVAVRADVFNALNTNVITTLTTQSGASFERPSAIMPPRIVQFSTTYTF